MKRATKLLHTVLTPELESYKLLPCATVTELTGLNRRMRLALERAGTFPKPITLSSKTRLYSAQKVLAWIEERQS